jgi:hypothetical protein
MRRHPGFTAIVVVTLALGIGANAIMFGVVDRLLLRSPAHVVEPDQVTRIYFREKAGPWLPGRDYTVSAVTSYPMVTALREGVPSLQEVGAFYCRPFTVGQASDAEEPDACLVTGNYFRLLGVQPALGRFFTPDEDHAPLGSPVAVLGMGIGSDTSAAPRTWWESSSGSITRSSPSLASRPAASTASTSGRWTFGCR